MVVNHVYLFSLVTADLTLMIGSLSFTLLDRDASFKYRFILLLKNAVTVSATLKANTTLDSGVMCALLRSYTPLYTINVKQKRECMATQPGIDRNFGLLCLKLGLPMRKQRSAPLFFRFMVRTIPLLLKFKNFNFLAHFFDFTGQFVSEMIGN